MAILHRKIQQAICEEIRDIVTDILKTYEGAADEHDDLYQSICYVAEFTCRNLFFRGLIEKEYAVQVFEATGGAMEDIENWDPELAINNKALKKPLIKRDTLMPEDILERAHSLGVAVTIPTFTMAWVEDGKIHVGEFNSPDHAMNRLGIIERNQEAEPDDQR